MDKDRHRLMDATLITVSLEPGEDGHQTQSQVTDRAGEVGSPQCAWKESGSLKSHSQCPSMCRLSTPPSGTCRIQILTTAQTFRQRSSHHQMVLVTYGAVKPTAKAPRSNFILHVAVSPPISPCSKRLQECRRISLRHCPNSAFHIQNQLHYCEFPQVSFRCGRGQTLSLLLRVRQTVHQSLTI